MRWALLLLTLAAGLVGPAGAVERFPPPEFTETDHQLPETQTPQPWPGWWDYVDIALLAGGLAGSAWLVLRYRRRWAIFALAVAAVVYFGFVRGGCICPIGAIQNVAAALADPSQWIGLLAVVFVAMVLLATLLFGRVFCAGLCPLGALQDLLALRPMRTPSWLDHALGLIAWAVLAVGVVAAATGCGFFICRYDPYVGFFRLGGPGGMLLVGAGLLVVGFIFARPFCRVLCPLGAIFRPLAVLSWKHATITPEECVTCRLCESACPVGAILPPTHAGQGSRSAGAGRLAFLLALLPALGLGGALLGRALGEPLADTHPTVALRDRIAAEQANPDLQPSDASRAWRAEHEPFEQLEAAARTKIADVTLGMTIAGALLGLVVGGKLITLNIRRVRTEQTIDRARCISCGRCFEACPVEHRRRKATPGREGDP